MKLMLSWFLMQPIVNGVISSLKCFPDNIFEISLESTIALLFMAPKLNISAETYNIEILAGSIKTPTKSFWTILSEAVATITTSEGLLSYPFFCLTGQSLGFLCDFGSMARIFLQNVSCYLRYNT